MNEVPDFPKERALQCNFSMREFLSEGWLIPAGGIRTFFSSCIFCINYLASSKFQINYLIFLVIEFYQVLTYINFEVFFDCGKVFHFH